MVSRTPLHILEHVPLAPKTTLALGGPARYLVTAHDEATLEAASAWAADRQLPLLMLGGGSNIIVPDTGYPGLVVANAIPGLSRERDGEDHLVTVGAGLSWDHFVADTVQHNEAGLECLSGIPGSVGATPIQNVGAYGQEISQRLESLRLYDRHTQSWQTWANADCDFSYRDSHFKQTPGRYLISELTFRLRPGGAPTLRYAELRNKAPKNASLQDIRALIISLRRSKSMVWDPEDPNRHSAGSFFTNPTLPTAEAEALIARCVAQGIVSAPIEIPRWTTAEGIKFSAGWLIERAGISKGLRRGPVGVSTRHALCLVHHGGGRTADLLALATEIQDQVRAHFGITLVREPILLDRPSDRLP